MYSACPAIMLGWDSLGLLLEEEEGLVLEEDILGGGVWLLAFVVDWVYRGVLFS